MVSNLECVSNIGPKINFTSHLGMPTLFRCKDENGVEWALFFIMRAAISGWSIFACGQNNQLVQVKRDQTMHCRAADAW